MPVRGNIPLRRVNAHKQVHVVEPVCSAVRIRGYSSNNWFLWKKSLNMVTEKWQNKIDRDKYFGSFILRKVIHLTEGKQDFAKW